MNQARIKTLALNLLKVDSAEDVVRVLKSNKLWDDPRLWRLYGDKEGNFAQVGNQQSLPEAALVEKIINSVDARLMNECLERGTDPESESAPRSVRDAVAVFFEGRRAEDNEAGSVCAWTPADRLEQSRHITLAATGAKPTRGQSRRNLCITIVDNGEGQSPDRIPKTILSLNEKNKQRIRFVQGKFNMGGSGALRFCAHGLQLVITRRNPKLAARERGTDPSADDWGITVVRREKPSNKAGEPISSEFTYLAPLGAIESPRKGAVLRFNAKSLRLMPQHDEPYARGVEWGTAIKLYEYESSGGQSNIFMKDGLLYSLERLVPEIGLPIRLHECRGYKGKKKSSFETPLAGLVVRLEEGKGGVGKDGVLETGFANPLTVQMEPAGLPMKARVYVFKENGATTYLGNEGVIFAINGQAHGNLPKSIFSRPKAVGLSRLRDSLLVLVNCSSLDAVQREDLFMSSRDRLSRKPIRYIVEREIEEMLRNNPTLRLLQEQRREQDVESKLSEEKPLEEVLGKVLKASPSLKSLFLRGVRLPRPFAGGGSTTGKNGSGADDGDSTFRGKKHPTFFRLPGREYGKPFVRNCEQDRRCRIKFETDVENGYFDRITNPGRFILERVEPSAESSPLSFSVTLVDGEAHLNLALPPEVEVGEKLRIKASVSDPTLLEPFVNVIELRVRAKQDHPKSSHTRKKKKRRSGAGKENEPRGIQLPAVIPVREGDAHWSRHKFDQDTACVVISDLLPTNGAPQLEHVFYINIDNICLKTEMKYSKQDPKLLEAKFKYGNVLIGLAMLNESDESDRGKNRAGPRASNDPDSEDDGDFGSPQDRIRRTSAALAPILVPMIDQLGGLREDDLHEYSDLGEDA